MSGDYSRSRRRRQRAQVRTCIKTDTEGYRKRYVGYRLDSAACLMFSRSFQPSSCGGPIA